MRAELVECWLCEVTIVPDGARIRYRDEQGRVHPWPDRRVRWAHADPFLAALRSCVAGRDGVRCDYSGPWAPYSFVVLTEEEP